MASNSKPYKTLPGPLRPRLDKRKSQEHPHSPLFGLNLNLSFSALFSSGVNFLDNLRKKTPVTPQSAPASSPSHSNSDSSSSPIETIEMVPFSFGEVIGKGEGHEWTEEGCTNPTWCDLCGELIWGLFDTGVWVCVHCKYTAHHQCRTRITLDCSSIQHLDTPDGSILSVCCSDEGSVSSSYTTAAEAFDSTLSVTLTTKDDPFQTLNGVTDEFHSVLDTSEEFHTLKDVEELEDLLDDSNAYLPLLALPAEVIERYITNYNNFHSANQHTVFDPDSKLFEGFIRVEMNLQRPINVVSGTRPPSFYNIIKDDTLTDRTLTTFYLPPGTEKAIHVTSHTTTQDVIRCLLKKFKVADNPHKYALYERLDERRRDSIPKGKSLSRLNLRRVGEDEKPLVCAILATERNMGELKKFILQENDPGEILWEQFSQPELKNFLRILDREEAWYKKRIHEKYTTVQDEIQRLLDERRREMNRNPVDDTIMTGDTETMGATRSVVGMGVSPLPSTQSRTPSFEE